jgi:hypothetical protein
MRGRDNFISFLFEKFVFTYLIIYRVIDKSRPDFRPLRYSSRDCHAEGEHVNRGRDNPSFCPTLQVLDMSTLGDAADVNPVIKFLPHTLQHLAVDSSDCLHDPLSQLWWITWFRGHVCTLLSTVRCCNVCGRNLITGLTSARHQSWTYRTPVL